MEGEAGERLGEAREEPRLWAEPAAWRVKSSSSADSTMVGEVHLEVIMSIFSSYQVTPTPSEKRSLLWKL